MTVPDDYVPGFVCHLGTCDVKVWGYVHYQPSIPGNAVFLAILGILAFVQLGLGIHYRTGLMAVTMLMGLGTEILGYIARILLHGDPFERAYFLWYLICLTIGPVFIAAAIYLSLGRIVVVYGQDISRIKPRTYTVVFLACDFVSLCVQAVGGGIAASTPVTNPTMVRHALITLCSGDLHILAPIPRRCEDDADKLVLSDRSRNTYSYRRSLVSSWQSVCIHCMQPRVLVACEKAPASAQSRVRRSCG